MTRASAVRHTAPNAAEPSAVMRLTVADGTSDGGISGAGGGEAGACADAANGITAEVAASPTHTMRLSVVFLRISFLPSFECEQYEPTINCGTRLRSTKAPLAGRTDDAGRTNRMT